MVRAGSRITSVRKIANALGVIILISVLVCLGLRLTIWIVYDSPWQEPVHMGDIRYSEFVEGQARSFPWRDDQAWTFEGQAGDTVRLTARADECYVAIAVYGPDNRMLAHSGADIHHNITVTLESTGTHTILVDLDLCPMVFYSLSIRRVP